MHKKVLIKIKGTQFQGEDSDVTELITTGSRYEKNNKTYILYDEISDESMQVTKNTIKISDNEIKLIKRGESSVDIEFRPGERWNSYYMTPFGNLKMTFCTDEVSVFETDGIMSVIIRYCIEADFEKVAEYLLEIQVEEK